MAYIIAFILVIIMAFAGSVIPDGTKEAPVKMDKNSQSINVKSDLPVNTADDNLPDVQPPRGTPAATATTTTNSTTTQNNVGSCPDATVPIGPGHPIVYCSEATLTNVSQ